MTTALAMIPMAGAFLSPQSSDTWVLVAFLIFLGILYFFGVHTFIGGALDRRADGIRKQLEEARQLREEAQSKLAEWQRKQQDVQTMAAEIVETARRDAEKSLEDARRSIDATVAQRLRAAEEQIALAESEAVRAVRNEAVDAAVAATADLLKKSIGAADASSMIDQAIQDVRTRVN